MTTTRSKFRASEAVWVMKTRAAPCRSCTNPGEQPALAGFVEGRKRVVENDKLRPFEQGADQPRLLALGEGQFLTRGTDIEGEAHGDDLGPQFQAVDHLGEDGADLLRGLGLAVNQTAEQQVILDRRRRVVTVGVVELDRLRLGLGQQLPEQAACLRGACPQACRRAGPSDGAPRYRGR